MRKSAILEKYFSAGTAACERLGSHSCCADLIFINILNGGNCHASHILRKLLKEWEIYQIKIRIEREVNKVLVKTASSDDSLGVFEELCEGLKLMAVGEDAIVNTGHFLIALILDKRTISSRVLESYHVTPQSVREYLTPLPEKEDYYENMQALERTNIETIDSGFFENEKRLFSETNNCSDYQNNDMSDADTLEITHVKNNGQPSSILERFAADMTCAAKQGKIDPVIGRDNEIERLVQILGRRKKNNPILIGEAGVGKSAIVEGLSLRIAEGRVPHTLRGKKLFSLDVASLVAGTKYRGEFEQRIKALLDELAGSPNIILFIDEIHNIVGAGSTQGSLDTANILKPALARGGLQCIGATTLDEYRQNIESDGALERRFQKILVEPTTKSETLQILQNIKTQYEKHHCVSYTDSALQSCVDLTDRYITDRQFPDKAIDVMDEAGSRAHIENLREPDALAELEKQIAELAAQKKSLQDEQQYEQIAEMRPREIALKSKRRELQSKWKREMTLNPIEIDAEQIEQVITSITGVPAQRVSKGERNRLSEMGEHLSGIVIGQNAAVNKVVNSIQRSRAGLKDPDKPIGVFMFVGPTGVGKTLLAKELSQWLFDKKESLIRIDMSEYSEKHNVSRLIGSPPGYVGYNEGGQLTEAVRRQPYAVVLFDEIEKAHHDVFNIMLQIFDEGQLTDGLGHKVDFRNTIIIMTSNVGSKTIVSKGNSLGYNTSNSSNIEHVNRDGEYRKSLEATFAPEFINRIDDIVIFNTLSIDDVSRIVDAELRKLSLRAENMGYKLQVSSSAKLRLAQLGYESRYGVRSLKRTITEMVEQPLAQMIISGEVGHGDSIKVAKVKDGVELSKVAV